MQKSRVAMLSAAHFINDSYHGFIAPLMPLLMTKLGITLTMAAVITSVASVFSSMSQPIAGHISDKMRSPYMVGLGPLITAIFLGSLGFAPSYASIILIVIFAGVGTAMFHPQAAVYTSKVSARQKGLGMSIFITGGSAGHALGPIIIMTIVTFFSLEHSWITIFFGAVISVFLLKNLPKLETIPTLNEEKEHVAIFKILKKLGPLTFVSSVRAFVIVGFIAFMPIYLTENNYSFFLSGSAITIFELSGAAGALFGGMLSDLYGRKSIILLSLILGLPFLLGFLVLPSFWAFISLGLAGLTLYAAIPVIIVMAQECYPERINFASSLTMGLSWGIGGVLVTPLGALGEKIGLLNAFYVLLASGVSAIIVAMFLPNTKRV